MIVGLTGGIASGKSTVSSILKKYGIEIVDADIVAKNMTELPENKIEIAKIFGEDVIDSNGNLLRKKIGEKAFSDRSLLTKLNDLIHPQVIEYFKSKKEGSDPRDIVIFDVPLLFEAKMDTLCDKIIVVTLTVEEQIRRVMLRDKIDEDMAKKIIDKQLSLEYKKEHSDIEISNMGTLDELEKEVEKVYKKLKEDVR